MRSIKAVPKRLHLHSLLEEQSHCLSSTPINAKISRNHCIPSLMVIPYQRTQTSWRMYEDDNKKVEKGRDLATPISQKKREVVVIKPLKLLNSPEDNSSRDNTNFEENDGYNDAYKSINDVDSPYSNIKIMPENAFNFTHIRKDPSLKTDHLIKKHNCSNYSIIKMPCERQKKQISIHKCQPNSKDVLKHQSYLQNYAAKGHKQSDSSEQNHKAVSVPRAKAQGPNGHIKLIINELKFIFFIN